MKADPLILASASPRRLSLLEQIGVVPQSVIPADIDESPLPSEAPMHYVIRVAELKAHTVAVMHPGIYILAADTVVICKGRIMGKARSAEDVHACLTHLSGRSHQVFSGLCVVAPDGRIAKKAVRTRIHFKCLTPAEIQRYLQEQEGIGKAGGYAIQGYAAGFVTHMTGSYSNVVGLPLYETRNALMGLGYPL